MRSPAASARRKRSTARSRSSSGGAIAAKHEVLVQFAGDRTAGRPIARVQPGGREVPLVGPTTGPNFFGAVIDLKGLVPGTYAVEIVEHLAGGAEAIVGKTEFQLSQPE